MYGRDGGSQLDNFAFRVPAGGLSIANELNAPVCQ